MSRKTGGTKSMAFPAKGSVQSFLPKSQQEGPLFFEPARKQETEEEKVMRYERVIETLRKQMENERKLLKQARAQLNRDM